MNEVEKNVEHMKKSLRQKARELGWLMPCVKFRDATFDEQMAKLREEVEEVAEAYKEDMTEHERHLLLMECADVQIVIETMMQNLLAANIGERKFTRKCVWEKNNARGYYMKP